MRLRAGVDGKSGAVAKRPIFNAAKTAKHAQEEGETLVEAGYENAQPDHEVDQTAPEEAGQPHGEDHPQRPLYKMANPFPPARAVKSSPMRLGGK